MPESGSRKRGPLAWVMQILLQFAVLGTLLFGSAEIVARVVFGFLPVTPAYFIFDYDPRWGWHQRPNADGTFVKLGFQQNVHINSHGLRGREIPYEKAEGVTRVLVLGDSNVAGLEVAEDETWVRVTESILRDKGYDVEFINAGHRAWGTDQSLLFLMDEGIKYDPDLVIYYFSANDVDDNSTVHRPFRKYGKPYFKLAESGELTLEGVPVPRFPVSEGTRIGQDGEAFQVDVPPLVRATLWVRDNVVTVSAFATAMVYVVAKLPGSKKAVSANSSFGDFQGREILGSENYFFRLTAALVGDMKRIAGEQGARFHMLGFGNWADAIRDQNGLPQLATMIRYREAIPKKENGERDWSQVTVPFDPHWNAFGQRLYSEIVADSLLQSGLLTGKGVAALE